MSHWRERFVPLIPAVLLVAVALHQIYLARVLQLSPWKGGGFGMFSSTELGTARYVRLFITAPNRSEELIVPESLANLAQRAAMLPADSVLKRLGEATATREQRKERAVSHVRIEVWRTDYDPETLAPLDRKIRDYVFNVDRLD